MASRTNYYEFQSAKVAIALALAERGWKLYGYHEDESDWMTDYYSPAWWDGIATKDGFVVVIDRHSASDSGREIRRYNYNSDSFVLSEKTKITIEKLSEIRQDRGASAQEEETAKKKIEALKAKVNNNTTEKYVVIDHYPEYQPNPPRMSWHVEKDGIIIAKGNGIGKFSAMKRFNKEETEAELKENPKDSYWYKQAEKTMKIAKAFETFLNKIDSAAGCMIGGNGKAYVYENIETIEYKTENKAIECEGRLRDGQCFIVKGSFNHGIKKGYVYRLHELENSRGDTFYSTVKLNGKLTKELTGKTKSNSFGYISGHYTDKFLNWIDKGYLAWCEIREVKTPHKVQKCVKRELK